MNKSDPVGTTQTFASTTLYCHSSFDHKSIASLSVFGDRISVFSKHLFTPTNIQLDHGRAMGPGKKRKELHGLEVYIPSCPHPNLNKSYLSSLWSEWVC